MRAHYKDSFPRGKPLFLNNLQQSYQTILSALSKHFECHVRNQLRQVQKTHIQYLQPEVAESLPLDLRHKNNNKNKTGHITIIKATGFSSISSIKKANTLNPRENVIAPLNVFFTKSVG